MESGTRSEMFDRSSLLRASDGIVSCPLCRETPGLATEGAIATAACWPHARQIISDTAPGLRQRVQVSVAERLESLVAELNELLRKSDWNNRHEARGREQDAWLRALHILAGFPGSMLSTPPPVMKSAPRTPSVLGRAQRAWRRLRPAKPVSMDLAAVKIENALQHEGCHVCRLASEGTRRWLFMLLWEGVMDPEIRGRIRAADGFCPYHWWRLVEVERQEMHGVTGLAILAEDTLSSFVAQLQDGRIPGIASANRCLACLAYRRGEDGALSGTSRHLVRSEFRATYLASSGCCSDHDAALMERLDDPDLIAIVINRRPSHTMPD
ncbi:MAG: hypothetical protein ACKVVP_23970 [Chloroflexota bacterium]